MPPREPPTSDAFAAEGARLAARGLAISDEMVALLAEAIAAVLADEQELDALAPESARDAVDFLVRHGRLARDEGEAIVQRAGGGRQPPPDA